MAYLDPGNRNSLKGLFYLEKSYNLFFFSPLPQVYGDMKAGKDGKYSLVWVLFLSTLFGYFFQSVAAKVGVVTGQAKTLFFYEFFFN